MKTARKWRCPDCAHVIRQGPGEPLPNHCLNCGAYLWNDADEPFVVKAPAISNRAKVKAVDDVYYGMEDASRARAEQMAAMTPGASASDFSHTLITDMNDRQKPGDIAWKAPPPNPVSQQMDFLRQQRQQGMPNVGVQGNRGSYDRPEFSHIPQGGLGAIRDIQLGHMDRMVEKVGGGTLNRK